MKMIEFDVSGLKEKIEAMDQGLCELNEKIHEFEQNKRNNLIFYGLNNDSKETPELLLSKVQSIVKVTLGIRREIPIPKVTRMYNGKTFPQLCFPKNVNLCQKTIYFQFKTLHFCFAAFYSRIIGSTFSPVLHFAFLSRSRDYWLQTCSCYL